jgi:putative ABC transport system permease protein
VDSETRSSPDRQQRAQGRGWVRLSIHFLVRSLTLRASAFGLALLAVTVGAAVTAVMLNLKADLGAKMATELRRYGPNLILTPDAAAGETTLDEAQIRALSFDRVAPLLIASGTVAADGGRPQPATIVGADFPALHRLNPSWRVAGEWPGPDGRSLSLIGASVAGRIGIDTGAALTLNVAGADRAVTVAGVLSTGEAEDDAVYVALPLLQEVTGRAGLVSLATLSVDGGPETVAAAAARLQEAVPGSVARPLRPIAAAQGAILGKLDRMMLLLTAVVLVLSGLCLTTTLMSIVLEREPEIGLMRSLGAGHRSILAMFLGEVSLLGLLGGGLGLLLGLAGSRLIGRRLFDAAIDPRADVIPLVIAIALVLCWIAVLVPLRRALAIQPAAALRGE